MRGQIRQVLEPLLFRLRTNANGFLKDLRYFLFSLVLAAAADAVTTIAIMMREGTEAELHPAVRLVSSFLGPIAGPILGKLCQLAAAVLVTLCFRRYAKVILVVVTFLYAWAAWYNLWGQDLYVPRVVKWLTF
jgi:hypothetical protein